MRVLDASALLAALLDEPGAERVLKNFDEAVISTVNLAEVAGKLTKKGKPTTEVRRVLDDLRMVTVPPDHDMAMDAGLMREITEPLGLSLADRFCLALARRLAAPVTTADRVWARIADLVGVQVHLIR